MQKSFPKESKYLIIGAGIAGLTAATSIRNLDKDSAITLINGESYLPYKRTNLSKYFASGFSPDDFTLATEEDLQNFYKIDLIFDVVTRIDYSQHLAYGKNTVYQYDYLILATGARYELGGLSASLQHPKLRCYHNKQETFTLQEELQELEHIAVLGAGVQGIETCYELLKMGKHASLIDPHSAPLSRFQSSYICQYLLQDLCHNDVSCHWNTRIQESSDPLLDQFHLVVCCFGTRAVNGLFPPSAQLQDNLLLAADDGVFACGDNIHYGGDSSDRCTLWHEAMDLGQLAGLNAARLANGTAPEQLSRVQRKPYRTKIEVKDKILFLAPPLFRKEENWDFNEHFLHAGNYYQFFLNQDRQLAGASLLCENRDLLKPLQNAIWEGLSAETACSELGIPRSAQFDGQFLPQL